MDGRRLTEAERRALVEIEMRLRQESRQLDHELSTMTRSRRARMKDALDRVRGRVVLALGLVSLTLLIGALRTASTALTWVFAISWALTLISAAVLLFRPRDGTPRDPAGPGRP
ncbi:DUF3040 domain-containing protein [Streptomyces sp. CoH27]|uniref:DUF3040 domain-containing protein n=1 Tax=Streptomyces sp. CoH27 TaxID=2875763 RepID=UPI001CD27E76|nr:DUF3040 domain-containing protein [Streptomyces sp. CoH27]